MRRQLKRNQHQRKDRGSQLKPAPPALRRSQRTYPPGRCRIAPQPRFVPQEQQADDRTDDAKSEKRYANGFLMESACRPAGARGEQRREAQGDAQSAKPDRCNADALRCRQGERAPSQQPTRRPRR